MSKISFSKKELDIYIIIFLFVLAAGIRLYDLNGAGGTFDEQNYLRIAVNMHEAIRSLDFSNNTWYFYAEHPPIGKYLLTAFYTPFINTLSLQEKQMMISGFYPQKTLPGEIYTPGRYLSVIYGGLTIVLIYLFCIMFLSRTTGLISGILLSVLPNFIPYFKIASLDAPTAFFYTLGVVFFAFAMKYDTWKWWIWLGIITGLCIATKFNLGLLLIFYAIMFLVWKGPSIWHSTKKKYNEKKKFGDAAKYALKEIWYWKLFWVPIIALIVLYISWPWLWPSPIERMSISLKTWSGGLGTEPWFGNMVGTETNYIYYFVYFLFTTPLLVLILFFVYLHYLYKNRKFWNIFVFVWFILPLLLWSTQAVKHDGMRLMTMIYPPLAILISQGLQHLLKKPKRIFYGAAILLISLLVLDIAIHPYYLDYYNGLVGGPKHVQEKNLLEFDWFGEGNKEAVEWLNNNAVQDAMIGAKWDPSHDLGGFRADLKVYDLIYKKFAGEPTYWMINHRYKQYQEKDDLVIPNLEHYSLVYTIKAGNGALGWIYKLKG